MTDIVIGADASVDLHLHTIYSDGTWTPEALIDYLISEQFALAAITDHDRVDIAAPLQTLAMEKGFRLLTAVEMSTQWHDELVDVLCFGFDPAANALQEVTDRLLKDQQASIRQTVEVLRQQGYALTGDQTEAILEKPAVQQPHALADQVRRMGYSTSERALTRPLGYFLLDCGLQQVTVDIGEVAEAAHRSNAVCLIAHPGRGDGYLCFNESDLDRLRAEVPIDGLEVRHPTHSAEQIAAFQAYADRHDLLTSAGSDSHKPEHPPIKYQAAWCRKLLDRLAIHVSGA